METMKFYTEEEILDKHIGKKYENKHFKEKKKQSLIKMNRQLSRRWGPANSAFRDYNKEIREENKSNDDAEDKKNKELAKPSKGYLKIQKNHAKLERRIALQRETTYHQMTAEIVKQAEAPSFVIWDIEPITVAIAPNEVA